MSREGGGRPYVNREPSPRAGGVARTRRGGGRDPPRRYHRAILLRPNHANAWYNLGVLLQTKSPVDDVGAEAAYVRALDLEPTAAMYVDTYALTLKRLQAETLMELAEDAILEDRHDRAIAYLAVLQKKLEQKEDAESKSMHVAALVSYAFALGFFGDGVEIKTEAEIKTSQDKAMSLDPEGAKIAKIRLSLMQTARERELSDNEMQEIALAKFSDDPTTIDLKAIISHLQDEFPLFRHQVHRRRALALKELDEGGAAAARAGDLSSVRTARTGSAVRSARVDLSGPRDRRSPTGWDDPSTKWHAVVLDPSSRQKAALAVPIVRDFHVGRRGGRPGQTRKSATRARR